MSADRWFYIDGAGTQFGPATAADVREALRLGRASEASLAWREGQEAWQPIHSLARELGLVPTAPPPIASATTPPPPPSAHGPRDADPYRAPQALEMQRVDRDDVVYAGFLRRLAAWFLDSLIIGIPLALVGAAFRGEPPALGGDPLAMMRMMVQSSMPQWLLGVVVTGLYYSLQESSAAQATLGKRALRIKVTDLRGERLSFAQALGRWFAAALSHLTLYIGFFMAGFTERKQALHDMVAGTLVVDRWAYTAEPERQDRSLSGCGVAVLLVMVLVFLAMVVAVVAAGYLASAAFKA